MNTDEIKARLEAATEGKWDNSTNERSEHPSVIYTDIDDEGSLIVAECRTVEDGDFIAHAPTDIKWLLEEVEETKARAFRNLIRDPWIRVEDGLPELEDEIIFIQANQVVIWGQFTMANGEKVFADNEGWFVDNITFWMLKSDLLKTLPIPPLPEGEK